jgi:hypothetical protein
MASGISLARSKISRIPDLPICWIALDGSTWLLAEWTDREIEIIRSDEWALK